ncbi:hypothetical protein [Sphingomonas oligoaromativorans]|uniref:hypothetical protein n=1 Tax=Sphingomonas oligoaromativorans TaxID=575322 RepID=UPI001420E81B|nr:hypothetical protein [Sphingomonas oligoaromativorans]NIJ32410.1 hypothetical protein [Sphingomonas oligoaromativorans]
MIHIIASFVSLLIALGATAVILRTLSDGAEKIRLALGLTAAAPPKIEARPARVRATVRPLPAMPARRLCVA